MLKDQPFQSHYSSPDKTQATKLSLFAPKRQEQMLGQQSFNKAASLLHQYFSIKRILQITLFPPLVLLIIYTILGGLALFMFLMGMLTVLATELWIFHVYFNYEDEAILPTLANYEAEESAGKQNERQGSNLTPKPQAFEDNQFFPQMESPIKLRQVSKDSRQEPAEQAPFESNKAEILMKESKESSLNLSKILQENQKRNSGLSQINVTGLDPSLQKGPLLEDGTKFFQDLQSNPFLNLSPNSFNQLKIGEVNYPLIPNGITERLGSTAQTPLSGWNQEKNNFRIVIRAKSQKIKSFLQLLSDFYTQIMKSEQICGGNYSRLGQPKISIIGQFNQSVLFKEQIFDDQSQLAESKVAAKSNYAFCKWKLIRKVFNEMGVCHIENALFYKQGVLANIKALTETVTYKVKQFHQKHAHLCEELDESEKRLLKIKQEYAKMSQQVEESISSYTKASQKVNNYQKLLELEMKFKLAYKQMQDCASKVSDALDSMCEAREKFNAQSKEMVKEIQGLERNKLEIFKSTLMSVVDTHYEFEVQIQSFFEECSKQNASTQKQLKLEKIGSSPKSKMSNSIKDESVSDEEDFFLQRKRSIKYKKEEVNNLMNEIAIEIDEYHDQFKEDNVIPPRISLGGIDQVRSRSQAQNPVYKDMRKDFFNARSFKEENQNEDLNEEEGEENLSMMGDENMDLYSPGLSQIQMSQLPRSLIYSPKKDKLSFEIDSQQPADKSQRSSMIKSSVSTKQVNFRIQPVNLNKFSMAISPLASLQEMESFGDSAFEKKFSRDQSQQIIQSRQTQMMIQGVKDLLYYVKQMKDNIAKYYKNHQEAIEQQFEEATLIGNHQIELAPNQKPQNIQKVRQLKIKRENNDGVNKIWSSFIGNFRSYLHQYEGMITKLTELHQGLEQYTISIQAKKNQMDEKLKQKVNQIKETLQKSKVNSEKIRSIQQSMQHSPQKQPNVAGAKKRSYQAYYEQYQQVKQQLLNFRESNISNQVLQKFDQSIMIDESNITETIHERKMQQIQLQKASQDYLQDYNLIAQETAFIQKQVRDKIIQAKSELVVAHNERSKNSAIFFRNLIDTIENSINTDIESLQEDEQIIQTEQLLHISHEEKTPQFGRHSFSLKDLQKEETKENESSINDNSFTRNISGGRFRSQSVRRSGEEFKRDPLVIPNLIIPDQGNVSFNFGKQVNIINNFSSTPNLIDNINQQSEVVPDKQFETANWFNRALSVFYNEWKTSPVFQNFILKEAFIVANKGRPKMLSEIEVHKVVLHGKAPEFQKVYLLESNPEDVLFDIDLSLRGTIEVLIKTEINLNWGLQSFYKIPLTVNILLRTINGRVRVFYSNDKSKGCWYGFVGRPVIRFNLDPIIGKDNKFSIKYIPQLRKLIEEMISKRFDKYSLPNKRPLSIPITKQSTTTWPRVSKQSDKSTTTRAEEATNVQQKPQDLPQALTQRQIEELVQREIMNDLSQKLGQQLLEQKINGLNQRQGFDSFYKKND